MKNSRILLVIAAVLALVMTLTACNIGGTTTPDPHKCESVCSECGKCLDAECTEDACADKCLGHVVTPDHKCESVCPECGLCLDAECAESACANKCEGHKPAESTPVITVNPTELEINAGDDIELMFGVTVSDELDEEPKLIIQDDDGFDAEVEGTYVITYLAQNKFGNTATATRTIKVNKALSALTLEVQKNLLGENKWQGTLLNFKNKEFVTLTSSATLDKQSGVFYNASSSSITVTVSNSDYAVVAIIDANGVVIEGRDGANNKLVNAANPVRANSSAKIDVNKVADDMVIPAGGYAIVVQNGYAGTGVDFDGRGFMNYNVIGTYGNVVRLVWADTQEVLTPYVDQAPVISGYNSLIYAGTGDFVLETGILAGVTATDDNGTFDITDDTTITVTVKNNGGFDINKPGKYTVTLEATDGKLTTTVTRDVEVTTESVEVKINNNGYTTLKDLIAIDQDITVLGKYLFVVYTPNYNGSLNWANGWGEAFIINKYGEVVRIYDGANGKYYDDANKAGVVDATKCTAAGYLTEAFNSRQPGEYLIVAPNGNGNLTRAFLLSNRTVGAKVVIPGITFAAHECESKCAKCGGCLDEACAEAACATKCSCHACESVCETCGKCTDKACTEEVCASKCEGHDVPAHTCESVCEHCGKCTDAACTEEVCASKCAGHEKSMFVTIGSKKYEAVEGMWAINQEITTANAATKAVWVFDKSYTGSFNTNGYGVAVVLDAYGRVIRVYDGANGGYWLPDGKQASAHFTVNTYATVAWSELQANETLVVFPNGADGNKARQIGLDCRYLFNQKLNLTGVEFMSTTLTVSVGTNKTYTAEFGMWAINEEITTANAATKAVWVFTKDYTGSFNTNGYGVAVVLDQYGRIIRVYDGANGGYWLPDGKQASAHFTVNTYATVAWSELQASETLVVFPNGADGNKARQIGLDCRYLFNQVMNITGIRFADPNKTITIGSKTYTATEGKWLYNTAVTTNTTANYAIIIYDKGFTGTFTTNGYGVALVLTAEGKVARVYDGANAGYTDATSGVNNKTYGVTVNNFATMAWESLQEGETLVILPNGGSEGNAARQVGLDCRWLIGQKMSITGFTFK